MHFVTINDELQELKQRVRALGKEVIKVEKVGNGNMAAFKLVYCEPNTTEPITTFFWRHDMDNFLAKFEQANKSL